MAEDGRGAQRPRWHGGAAGDAGKDGPGGKHSFASQRLRLLNCQDTSDVLASCPGGAYLNCVDVVVV